MCPRVEHGVGLLGAGDRKLRTGPEFQPAPEATPDPSRCARARPCRPRTPPRRRTPAARAAGRGHSRQELIHLDVVREREDELVDDSIFTDRSRHRRDLDVLRPLADEVRRRRTRAPPWPRHRLSSRAGGTTYGSPVIVAIVASRSMSTNSAATCSSKTAARFGALDACSASIGRNLHRGRLTCHGGV